MKKVLCLKGEGDPYISEEKTEQYIISADDLYNKKINRKLVRVFRKLPKLFFAVLGNWKKESDETDVIITFSSDLPVKTVRYIAKKYPNIRIIFYLYGRVFDNVPAKKGKIFLEDLKKLPSNVEVWTYDKQDSNDYGFKYNKSFFTEGTKKRVKEALETDDIVDVAFVANNKGREAIIKNVYTNLKKYGLRLYFYVLNAEGLTENRCIDNKTLDYGDYLKILNKSRAVLDIVNNGNYGLTLRVLESLIAKKKLITNYLDIKEFDFYNSNNIFLIGEDDWEEIVEFLSTPYDEISEDIIESYSESAWIDRFLA